MGQSWAGSSCHLGTKNHPKQSLSSCHSTLRAVWKFREIDEFLEVKLCSCPRCGGTQFKDQNAIEQIIEDIPPVRPHVTRLTTYHATCVGCGQTVRSQHPLQMSLAIGAAGVQLGSRALALAADLNKAKGLSMRKTCAVLRELLQPAAQPWRPLSGDGSAGCQSKTPI